MDGFLSEGVRRHNTENTLTRCCLDALGQHGLVPAGGLAQGLVAGADGHDGGQRDDEAQVGRDVPLAEDDAEVFRVPGEEHLPPETQVNQRRSSQG